MPKSEQTVPVNLDKEKILAIAYSAFTNLGWNIQYAGEDKILAHTPKNWKTYGEDVIAGAVNGQLIVSSELHESASFDLMKKNKKNIAAFLAAFESAKNISSTAIEQNYAAIDHLRVQTLKVAEQEQKSAAEVDAVMNLSKSNLWVTYAIIAINVLVFVVMCVSGVSIFSPTTLDIVKWGGNFAPLTLTGDWWRLLSCVFVHIGIIHIVFNMYALYMVGVYLEPMLGKLRYTAAYLCTGILSSIVSLWWHKEPVASAGASGAIFGMFGLFLALLSTNLIPKQTKAALLQSIVIFVVYNLVYGMKSGVDNSAHIGGLISGLVIGYAYYLTLKGVQSAQKKQLVAGVVLIGTVLIAYSYINSKKSEVAAGTREQIGKEIHNAQFKDAAKFNDKKSKLGIAEDKALNVLRDSTLNSAEQIVQLRDVSLPQWKIALDICHEMQALDVSPEMKKRANLLEEYLQLRTEQTNFFVGLGTDENDENNSKEAKKIQAKINDVLKRLKE